ncbi:hemolysin D, partial [Bacillus bombysepticus]
SIVPKNLEKRARIILSPQDRKNIKKGDKIIYSFNTERIDKYIGEIVYIAAEPVYNKEFKSYMYELEATIDSNNDELYAGMMGQGSVLIGSEPIWKFLLKKMI